MKAIQVFVLIGFCTTAIFTRTVFEAKAADEKNRTAFIANITNEFEILYNRSFLEATKNGISNEEFVNLTTKIPIKIKNLLKVLDRTKLADYPKVPTPIDVLSEGDNKIELRKDLKNAEGFLWGIYHEVDSVAKSIIERANKMETDLNKRAKIEMIISLFNGITKEFCGLKNAAPENSECICDDKFTYPKHDCFQLIDNWTNDLRRSVTEGIQKIIDKMYKFPGDLNAFSHKSSNDGELFTGMFFIMRHMRFIDEAYDDLKAHLNRFESKAQEDVTIKERCTKTPEDMLDIYFYAVVLPPCLRTTF